MKHSRTAKKTDVAKPYERTPQEWDAVSDTHRKRQATPLPTFAVAGVEDRKATLRITHPDEMTATAVLHKAVGQPHSEGLDHALLALMNVSSAVLKPTD